MATVVHMLTRRLFCPESKVYARVTHGAMLIGSGSLKIRDNGALGKTDTCMTIWYGRVRQHAIQTAIKTVTNVETDGGSDFCVCPYSQILLLFLSCNPMHSEQPERSHQYWNGFMNGTVCKFIGRVKPCYGLHKRWYDDGSVMQQY